MTMSSRTLSEFATDDLAFEWAQTNLACVTDDNGACVFCFRADH